MWWFGWIPRLWQRLKAIHGAQFFSIYLSGFKAWCERYAVEKRAKLGLKPSDPLDAFRVAKNLGITVWTPHDVPGLDKKFITTLRHRAKKEKEARLKAEKTQVAPAPSPARAPNQ